MLKWGFLESVRIHILQRPARHSFSPLLEGLLEAFHMPRSLQASHPSVGNLIRSQAPLTLSLFFAVVGDWHWAHAAGFNLRLLVEVLIYSV